MVIRLPDGTQHCHRLPRDGAGRRDPRHVPRRRGQADARQPPRAARRGHPRRRARAWSYAHRKYGKLPWRELVQPAIALARDGVALDAFHADEMAAVTRAMIDYAAKVPATNAALREAMVATLRHLPQGRRHDLRHGRHLAAARARRHARGDRRRRRRTPSTAARSPARWRRAWPRWAASGPQPISPATRPSSASRSASRITGTTSSRCPRPRAAASPCGRSWPASDALHLERLDWDSVDRIHLYVEALRRIYADSTQLARRSRLRRHPADHASSTPATSRSAWPTSTAPGPRRRPRSGRRRHRPSISRPRTSRSSMLAAWRWRTPTR